MSAAISAEGLFKTYRLGKTDVPVLRGVSLEVAQGEWVALLGQSGSGKSTLLHLLGGLDRPDKGKESGRVVFEGEALAGLSDFALDRLRARRVGFVFQFYHLLPELTALENVLVPSMVRHGTLGWMRARGDARKRGKALLERFGLGGRLAHRPVELSGGERQRVAIARALVNDPSVVLADEPTGNLDTATGDVILDDLASLREERGRTIVMVTHDEKVAARGDRVLTLADGVIKPVAGR